ncbi:MAG: hypothetical protein ACEQSR_13705 [Candidatus Methylacidiphilales bacterium]
MSLLPKLVATFIILLKINTLVFGQFENTKFSVGANFFGYYDNFQTSLINKNENIYFLLLKPEFEKYFKKDKSIGIGTGYSIRSYNLFPDKSKEVFTQNYENFFVTLYYKKHWSLVKKFGVYCLPQLSVNNTIYSETIDNSDKIGSYSHWNYSFSLNSGAYYLINDNFLFEVRSNVFQLLAAFNKSESVTTSPNFAINFFERNSRLSFSVKYLINKKSSSN